MKRPLAQRHLARLYELVTSASICRVAEERALLDSPVIPRTAAGDRTIAEEVLSLARERGWNLPEVKPYAWQLMATYSDPRPRIMRVLGRDTFELEGIYRQTDDDDVASLAAELLAERRVARRELEAEDPKLTLPGAK